MKTLAGWSTLGCGNGQVSFQWKDYRDIHRGKTMTLAAEEFIRRFLLHAADKTSTYAGACSPLIPPNCFPTSNLPKPTKF